jgi:hypothetical protein
VSKGAPFAGRGMGVSCRMSKARSRETGLDGGLSYYIHANWELSAQVVITGDLSADISKDVIPF